MSAPIKILILEDSHTDAEIVQRLLNKTIPASDFHVAMSKSDYIRELEQFQPDVILSDNSLPQFNAAEALKIVRAQSLTPFIMVTGAVSEEFAAAIIKSGADDYVLKDRLAKLPVAIEGALKQRRAEKDLKLAEKKLVESERRFRAMIENNADAILLTDRDLTPLYQSPSAERLSGISITDRKANPGLQYTHPDDLPLVRAAIDTSLKQPGHPIPFQSRLLHARGYYLWIEGVVTNLLFDTSIRALAFNYRDVTERKKAEDKLNESLEEIRQLASHLQDVREEERAAMAREIHDELGQQLTGLKMDMTWLLKRTKEDDPAQQKLKGTLELLDTMVKTVRKIATDLRPSILDDLGLVEAMEWQSKEFERRSGIPVHFAATGQADVPASGNLPIALFRIYQESLTNVARHSGATQVNTMLEMQENLVTLSITDNGRGFDTGTTGHKKTLGLLGMKERSLTIGGHYNITSKPGSGTTVLVAVPYRHASWAASDV